METQVPNLNVFKEAFNRAGLDDAPYRLHAAIAMCLNDAKMDLNKAENRFLALINRDKDLFRALVGPQFQLVLRDMRGPLGDQGGASSASDEADTGQEPSKKKQGRGKPKSIRRVAARRLLKSTTGFS